MRIRVIVGIITSLLVSSLTIPAGAASPQPRVPGMTIVASTMSFDDTWTTLIDTLDANPAITVVATLDHAANAASAGLDLPPTKEVFFGNPALGTPVMQASQTAGIDLPQHLLVWQDQRGRTFVGYNHPEYVAARHRTGDVETQATIEGALAAITAAATGTEVAGVTANVEIVARNSGLVFVASDFSADETFQRLISAIEAAPPNIVFTLEHDVNAGNAGLELRPTKLIVFGSPVLGTPLMQQSRTIGIDLPQKFLVFEDADGAVHIAYNDPFVIARRHGISPQTEELGAIADALAGLAAGAATG